jgi:pimeloyl-ACP methyl ester carboxylesterase
MTQWSKSADEGLPRRTVLKAAGIGMGAGLVFGLRSGQAQTTGPAATQSAEGPIWSAEYWARKGDVALNLWRKRMDEPKPGERQLPVLFLVHGSSNSARSSYDLAVLGRGEYSLMNVFARYGYDVWTMDHDGYGRSGSSGNNSDIASGVEDLYQSETGNPLREAPDRVERNRAAVGVPDQMHRSAGDIEQGLDHPKLCPWQQRCRARPGGAAPIAQQVRS